MKKNKMISAMNRTTYDDLCDDAGLAERAERQGEAPGEDEHEADLQDDERQREVQRVVPLPQPLRRRLHRRAQRRRRLISATGHRPPPRRVPALPMARARESFVVYDSVQMMHARRKAQLARAHEPQRARQQGRPSKVRRESEGRKRNHS